MAEPKNNPFGKSKVKSEAPVTEQLPAQEEIKGDETPVTGDNPESEEASDDVSSDDTTEDAETTEDVESTVAEGPEGEVLVNIPRDFAIALEGHHAVQFKKGVHTIKGKYLEHWYVKANGVTPL